MSGNSITVVGNLTRDPELKFTPSGQAVTKLSIAHNHRTFNKNSNDWDEKVSYFDCVVWGRTAENVAETLEKGVRVIGFGRLDQNTWEKDGEKRSKNEIVIESIGPDLTFATATVTKNTSDGNSSRSAAKPVELDQEPF